MSAAASWRRDLLVCLLVMCPAVTCSDCSAGAAEEVVDAGELCSVQRKIRWRSPAWTESLCRDVAGALNESLDPLLLEAVCINESDLRPTVVSFARHGVYDVGLCGVRCVLYPGSSATARGYGPRSAEQAADLPAGRCQNGLARGYTLSQLLDGPTNVRLAGKILSVSHGWDLRRYSGGTRERGYAGRVRALRAALAGEDVLGATRGQVARESRIQKLTRQILEVTRVGR